MRLRHIENSHDLMEKHPLVVVKPEIYDKNIQREFLKSQPLHVEFGSGYGGYLFKLSRLNRDINYLAFEWNSKVIIRGLKSMETEEINNFRFVHGDARRTDQYLEENSVDRIYLNFSDPWPKSRHTKRRLTSNKFLRDYASILKDGGELHFKTDNDDLFEYSVEEFQLCGWKLKMVTRDLHNSEYAGTNIMTEYEEKFSKEGKTINKLIAIKII